jgi:RNA recognition motif. (a.k.a. RRM, RBD, or RNP domain)
MRIAGDVTHVDVLQDEQGRSKCCAVVRYASPPEAHAAITAMNGSVLQVCESVLSTQQPLLHSFSTLLPLLLLLVIAMSLSIG